METKMSLSEQQAPPVAAEPMLYGREGVEHDQGYEPLPLASDAVEQEPLTLDEAVAERAKRKESEEAESRTPETEVRTYSPLGDLPDKVTLTIEQASAIRSEERQAAEKAAEEAAN